jgi:hypothetical protein
MNIRRQKISVSKEFERALADIGGEPLAGSGFENEMPEAAYANQDPYQYTVKPTFSVMTPRWKDSESTS